MPTILDVEAQLRFTFDDDWLAIKLDENDFFRTLLMPLQLTKAVDILAVYRQRELFFIEVKDYRNSRIELKNAEKMHKEDTLNLQIARKVEDSLACVVAAARHLDEPIWSQSAEVIHSRRRRINVVFWLEFDVQRRKGRRKFEIETLKAAASNRRTKLAEHLAWLKQERRSVHLVNQRIRKPDFLPGVAVVDLRRVRRP